MAIFITKEKTNWKYILIIAVLALIVAGESFLLLKQTVPVPNGILSKTTRNETAKCENDEMIFYFRPGCGWCNKVKDDGSVQKLEDLGVTVTQFDITVGPVEHQFSGVPTFVIDNKAYSGYRTFEQLKELLGC